MIATHLLRHRQKVTLCGRVGVPYSSWQLKKVDCFVCRKIATTSLTAMKFKTVKAVRQELELRGGFLETIRDTESPEYAPHLSTAEQGWPHGAWIKDELLLWASEHLTHA